MKTLQVGLGEILKKPETYGLFPNFKTRSIRSSIKRFKSI